MAGKDHFARLHARQQHIHDKRCMRQAVDAAFGNTADFFQRDAALLGNDVGEFFGFAARHCQIMYDRNRVVFLCDEQLGNRPPCPANSKKLLAGGFFQPVDGIKVAIDFSGQARTVGCKDSMKPHGSQGDANAFFDFPLIE